MITERNGRNNGAVAKLFRSDYRGRRTGYVDVGPDSVVPSAFFMGEKVVTHTLSLVYEDTFF